MKELSKKYKGLSKINLVCLHEMVSKYEDFGGLEFIINSKSELPKLYLRQRGLFDQLVDHVTSVKHLSSGMCICESDVISTQDILREDPSASELIVGFNSLHSTISAYVEKVSLLKTISPDIENILNTFKSEDPESWAEAQNSKSLPNEEFEAFMRAKLISFIEYVDIIKAETQDLKLISEGILTPFVSSIFGV